MEAVSRQLKIAYFSDNFYPVLDGVTKVVETYCKHMHGRGHSVTLFAPSLMGYHADTPAKIYECSVMRKKYFGYYVAKFDPGFAAAAERYIIEERPDIIHIHTPFAMGRLGAKLAKKYGIPCVFTFHSQYKRDFLRYTKSHLISWLFTKIIMTVINKSDVAFTMNAACEKLLRKYGYKKEIRIVRNATEYECGSIEAAAAAARQADKEFSLAGQKNVMMFVGRIFKQKNVFFLVEVLKILSAQGLDFKFIFAGEGKDRAALQRLIRRYGLLDKTLVLGHIADRAALSWLYARADLILFPSLYDTNSLTQIEAAAYYTPTLFLENAVTADLVTADVNGYFAPHNTEAYAAKVINILSDPEKLKSVGQNAHNDIYITWQQSVEAAERNYYDITARIKVNAADAIMRPQGSFSD